MKNLGVEVITKTLTGRTAEEFIPSLQIADVVINEVIHMVCTNHKAHLLVFL